MSEPIFGARGASPSMMQRYRDSKMPVLPPPGADLMLRPHTTAGLVIELLAAAVGAYVFVDAALASDWTGAVFGLVWALAFGVGGVLTHRRSTHAGPDGLRVRGLLRRRLIPWSEVGRFELAERGRLLKPQILVQTTDDEWVKLPHQDAKSLSLRPDLSRQFYLGLIDRLETIRRAAGP
jgi:hypothetical protein